MQSKLAHVLIPFFLLGVLLSPSIGQWVHLADAHHEESMCTEVKVHFHAKELNCELTATFTNPYTPSKIKPFSFVKPNKISEVVFTAPQDYFFQQINFFHLRGPPRLLTFS